MFTAVLRAGLRSFCPDILGPPNSVYNQLHRHLAVSTFQQVASAFGYTALGVNITFTRDYHLLSQFYDTFVFGTLKNNTRLEAKGAGRLAESLKKTNTYRRRTTVCSPWLHCIVCLIFQSQLAKSRYQIVKSEGWRKPIRRLVENPDTHSDDERIETGFSICVKPGRNPIVTQFLRDCSDQYRDYLQRNARPNTKLVAS